MEDLSRRDFVKAALCAAAASGLAAHPMRADAQDQQQMLRLLFGYPAGGVGDVICRGLAGKLTGSYAKTVIVDNRPGAAGKLVIDVLKSSPPDGSTLLISPSSVLAMYPHVYAKLPYDPFSDLMPVSNVCEFVHALAVGPGVPESVKNLSDFIGWCKENPKQANVANPGEGSLPHFLTLMLSKAIGVPLQAVAYRGSSPAVNDLVGGQVTAMMASEGSFATFTKGGKVRLLATSGPARSRFSPNVQTFAEQGAKGIVISEWIALFAPAKTPPAVVERASQAARAGLAQHDLAEQYGSFAVVPAPSTPSELAAKLRADSDFWGPTIRATGFTPLS